MPSVAALYAPVSVPLPPPTDEPWQDYFEQHRDLAMPAQTLEWTCSVCSTQWVLHASGLDTSILRPQTALRLGYPNCVNPAVGLADTQCAVEALSEYGVPAHQEWVDWGRAVEICAETTGLLNSTTWQHFVAIRGLTLDGSLWVANSAPGYRGIWDTVSYDQFQAWRGSWQIVWLEPE